MTKKSLRPDCSIRSWQQHSSKHWRLTSCPRSIDCCPVRSVKISIIIHSIKIHMIGWVSVSSYPGLSGLSNLSFIVLLCDMNLTPWLKPSHAACESALLYRPLIKSVVFRVSLICSDLIGHQLDPNSNNTPLDRETSEAIDHSWCSRTQIQYGTARVKYLLYQELSKACRMHICSTSHTPHV